MSERGVIIPDGDNDKDDDNVDLDYGNSKSRKNTLIIGGAILISIVVYFMFGGKSQKDEIKELAEEDRNRLEQLEKSGSIADSPVYENLEGGFENFENGDFDVGFVEDVEEKVNSDIPELPSLPSNISMDLSEEIKKNLLEQKKESGEFFTKEQVDAMIEEKLNSIQYKDNSNQNIKSDTNSSQSLDNLDLPDLNFNKNSNISSNNSNSGQQNGLPNLPNLNNRSNEDSRNVSQKSRVLQERRGSPMFKVQGKAISGFQDKKSSGIIVIGGDAQLEVEYEESKAKSTKIPDLSRVVIEGKVIDAVLETAINTDSAGIVTAIVSRDVYSSFEKNVLIPRGSKLIGSFDNNIKRGQTRLDIVWNRIIRVDGLTVEIQAKAADRIGRAGLEGQVDNKYAEILGNSFLSSAITIASAVATEKTSNTTGTEVTTNTDGTTTTTSSALDDSLNQAISNFMNDADTIVNQLANQKPTITIPQGEKITIIVDQDITLPIYKKD